MLTQKAIYRPKANQRMTIFPNHPFRNRTNDLSLHWYLISASVFQTTTLATKRPWVKRSFLKRRPAKASSTKRPIRRKPKSSRAVRSSTS